MSSISLASQNAVFGLLLMVEPLAAAISTRPSLLKLALSSMARPPRRPFPADFFSPLPRQYKGKEKAVDPPSLECNQCWLPRSDPMSSSSCISRHSPCCPVRSRLFVLDEAIPRRSHPFPFPSQRCTRRHASNAARALSSQTRFLDRPLIPHPTHEFEGPADKLRSLLTAPTPLDPSHAWSLYVASARADATNSALTPSEQLRFIHRLLDAFELSGDTPPNLPLLYTWGTRLQPILRDLKSHLGDSPLEITSFQCFTAQVHAWLGDVAQASQLARRIRGTGLTRTEECILLSVYRNILVLSRYQQGVSRAVDLLIQEWNFLGIFYDKRTKASPETVSFRKVVHGLLADVSDGAGLLQSRSHVVQDDRLHMGELLLDAYCSKRLLHQAHALVLEMGRQKLPVKFSLQVKLTRLLARNDLFAHAQEIFATMDSSIDPRQHHSTGLYLYSRCGDVDRAEHFFNKHYDNIPAARCMLMHAYAITGKVEKVVELFHKFFPTTSEDEFLAESPRIVHYTTVILAHAEVADFDGINLWLGKMLKAGCLPDAHVYSIILQSFARRGDIDSVAAVFDQMRAAGIKSDCFHYTSVISLLSRRKDAVAAEAYYLQALHEGITPDRKMITSLMNAHVEAGSWEGVVRVFDYLRHSPHFRRDLSVEVFNTLLKAHVLIGTPLRIMLAMFRKLVRVGIRPDCFTYALVIQSACDAGKMSVAEELFAEMERKAKPRNSLYQFDAYTLTIIMAGHVRQRSKAQAMACYEEMRRRGIKPNSLVYKQVLQAYANDRTEASLEIAESFLKQIMDKDADDPNWTDTESRASALGNIYSPLILVYAKKVKPGEVAQLFNRMLESGGGASLETLTILLDVHRRANNLGVVRELWPQIRELALRLSCADELFKRDDTTTPTPMLRRRSNLLCMPLSIYIDTLSAAGEHHAVLDAWTTAKSQGFSFDAHNWNHLAVALVRAGELDRAFEVLERVLIPYSRKGISVRDPSPESPLVFDVMDPEEDTPASDAPMRRKSRRAKAVKAATYVLGTNVDMSEDSTDFAHPLHILHQVIPGLSMWRPHAVTLQVLSKVLGHLQRGRLVQPVCASDTPLATLPSQTGSQHQVEIANATLERIYHNYPEAVRAVLLYERERARREAVQRSRRERIKDDGKVADTLGDGRHGQR